MQTPGEELTPATARPAWTIDADDDARLLTRGRGLVLVVEDDVDIREALTGSLEASGYAVVEASDGEEALDRLETGLEPDVIVLDLMMPRLDGWGFLERLRADPDHADVPVLVTSASQDRRPVDASAWLSKPFHIDDFDRTVARLCGH